MTVNSWINLNALWKIVVIGLLAGAGLPALFAVGLRALAPRGEAVEGGAGTGTGSGAGRDADVAPAPNLPGKLAAGLCFAAVVAAMVWGVVSIVQHR